MRKSIKTNKQNTLPIYSFYPKSKSVQSNDSANDFYQQHLPKISQYSVNSNSSQPEQEVNATVENQSLKQENEKLKLENAKLHTENQKLRKDFTGLLKIHKETCRLYVNKEINMKLVEKKIIPQVVILYDSFESDLGRDVLKKLRTVRGNQRSDSTLILQCMRGLFENIDELKMVSAYGKGGNKTISPKKREILNAIFLERLASENMDDTDKNLRYIRLNRLINTAIAKINRSKLIDRVSFF